jgi:hypothetical protein
MSMTRHGGITLLGNIENDVLVDIRDVSVDRSLPKHERIVEFVRQIKNPYRFRCGKYSVSAKFNENGLFLEDCLQIDYELEIYRQTRLSQRLL